MKKGCGFGVGVASDSTNRDVYAYVHGLLGLGLNVAHVCMYKRDNIPNQSND